LWIGSSENLVGLKKISLSTLFIGQNLNPSNSSKETFHHSSSTKPVTYQNATLFSASYSDNHHVIEPHESNNFTDITTSQDSKFS